MVVAAHSECQHMETPTKLLKSGVQSPLALHKQFVSLEHGIVPAANDCQSLFPAKVAW